MIIFKSIKPATKFRSSTFRDSFRQEAIRMSGPIVKDFDKTVATWKEEDKPEFESIVKVGNLAGGKLAKQVMGSASGVSLEVSTDSAIYLYLDEGTEVRYATMSKDFQAKTRPRFIGSRRGRGRRLFVSKKHPRPGIKAREFTKTIAKKWTTPFRQRMDKALKDAAAKSGHSIK